MGNLQRYRIKTHEELLDSGFALTPGGEYVHPTADKLTREMLELASKFEQRLIAVIFEAKFQTKIIDGAVYHVEHFVGQPALNIVRS